MSWSSASTAMPTARSIRFAFEGMIYVLHAFQKKSPSGIRTAQTDIDLVGERLKRAREHYERNHQLSPKGKAGKHGQ